MPDRRFSKWYTSGVKDWLAAKYRVMKPWERDYLCVKGGHSSEQHA